MGRTDEFGLRLHMFPCGNCLRHMLTLLPFTVGGWCEFHEYEAWFFSDTDPTLSKCPDMKNWIHLVNEASSNFGKELDIAPKLRKLFADTGFVDIKDKLVHVSLIYIYTFPCLIAA